MQLDIQEGAGTPDWRLTLERRAGKLSVVESLPLVRKELLYTNTKRPAPQVWSTDAGEPPVGVLDLHRTLTPAWGYPLEPPWPGVKEALDMWAAQGVILVIASGGLAPDHDRQILDVRLRQTQAWIDQYALPISLITGKVTASCYYDDRQVPVPENGDWTSVVKGVEEELDARSEVDKDGMRRLVMLPDTGKEIADYPDIDLIPGDQPRGWSGKKLDVDVHRCLSSSNSSQSDGKPKPGATDALAILYPQYTIHLSCAGWDPATHDAQTSDDRLAGLRRWVRANAIPYDNFVSKCHGTFFIDDRGVKHRNWNDDLPILLEKMATPHPQDEVTLFPMVAGAD